MIRYVIRNKETGKFLYRTKSGGCTANEWVDKADDATLITTSTGATLVTRGLLQRQGFNARTEFSTWASNAFPNMFPIEVIKVGVLIYPVKSQPFFDGVLNGNVS